MSEYKEWKKVRKFYRIFFTMSHYSHHCHESTPPNRLIMENDQNPIRPLIITMFSPRQEFGYRFHDALMTLPNIKKRYRFLNIDYDSVEDDVPDISQLGASGIITSVGASFVDTSPLIAHGIPIVNISLSPREGMMSLFVEPDSIAEIVTRHAVGAHYQKLHHVVNSVLIEQRNQQGESLKNQAEKANIDYQQHPITRPSYTMGYSEWMEMNKEFIQIITREKKRTLYFAGFDESALHILRIMQHLGIQVPERAGILGRGNNTASRLSDPDISSVKWPWMNLASTAIEMLEKNDGDRRIPSAEVFVRGSSVQTEQRDNQWIFKVADMIERYGHEGITVDKLIQYARVSKRTLDRHYTALYGITPAVAIRKSQMNRAKNLLKKTDLTIENIARSVGFSSIRAFFRAFDLEFGTTPGAYRKMQL